MKNEVLHVKFNGSSIFKCLMIIILFFAGKGSQNVLVFNNKV